MKAGEIIVILGKELYKSRCFVCLKKVKEKGFTIHHLRYIENDIIHSNYKNRDRYYEDLQVMVRLNPNRFMLLCNTHHQSVERLNRFSLENRKRLMRAVKLSMKQKMMRAVKLSMKQKM